MITKSVNAGCRSETTVNTFSDHDGSPRRLGLHWGYPAGRWRPTRRGPTERHTTTQKTVLPWPWPCNASDPRRPQLSGIEQEPRHIPWINTPTTPTTHHRYYPTAQTRATRRPAARQPHSHKQVVLSPWSVLCLQRPKRHARGSRYGVISYAFILRFYGKPAEVAAMVHQRAGPSCCSRGRMCQEVSSACICQQSGDRAVTASRAAGADAQAGGATPARCGPVSSRATAGPVGRQPVPAVKVVSGSAAPAPRVRARSRLGRQLGDLFVWPGSARNSASAALASRTAVTPHPARGRRAPWRSGWHPPASPRRDGQRSAHQPHCRGALRSPRPPVPGHAGADGPTPRGQPAILDVRDEPLTRLDTGRSTQRGRIVTRPSGLAVSCARPDCSSTVAISAIPTLPNTRHTNHCLAYANISASSVTMRHQRQIQPALAAMPGSKGPGGAVKYPLRRVANGVGLLRVGENPASTGSSPDLKRDRGHP
jgi:hypothetical protein